jgi:uncharacterized membrane protein YccC
VRKLFIAAKGRKEGAMDGLNLFFGALLGANLGTIAGLKLVTYVQLIVLLVGTVMALRIFAMSERRLFGGVLLGFYVAALIALASLPGLQPRGLATADLNRLIATLIVWIAMVVLLEIFSQANAPEAAPSPEE